MRWSLAAISCSAVVLFACSESQTPTEMVPASGLADVIAAPSGQGIPNRYIVVFKQNVAGPAGEAQRMVGQAQGKLHFIYTKAIKGFAAELSPRAVQLLRADPSVALIEQDQVIKLETTQNNPVNWGLDRIDQRNLPLSLSYTYNRTGAGVHFYGIDTGINLTHNDLCRSRGQRVRCGHRRWQCGRLQWTWHSHSDDCGGNHLRCGQGRDGPPGPRARLRRLRHDGWCYRRHRLGYQQSPDPGRGEHEPGRWRFRHARSGGCQLGCVRRRLRGLRRQQQRERLHPVSRARAECHHGRCEQQDRHSGQLLELRHLCRHLRAGCRTSPRAGSAATRRPRAPAAPRCHRPMWPASLCSISRPIRQRLRARWPTPSRATPPWARSRARAAAARTGCSTWASSPVAVAAEPAPVANFTATCNASHSCTFTSTSTDDVGIVAYEWKRPSGVIIGSTQVITFTFATAGSKDIILTVTDGGGLTGTITKTINVP